MAVSAVLYISVLAVTRINVFGTLFTDGRASGGASWGGLMAYAVTLPLLNACFYVYLSPTPWQIGTPLKNLGGIRLQGLAIYALAFATVIRIDHLGFSHFFPAIHAPGGFWPDVVRSLLFGLMVGHFVVSFEQVEAEGMKAERTALEAQTRLLAAQVSPHALGNSLTAIGLNMTLDPQAAERQLEALGGYMRGVLSSTRSPLAELSGERALIQQFLEVESIRLGNRLRVEWAWDESLNTIMIPPMLVQPLVENAVRHGIRPNPKGGSLFIRGGFSGTTLEMEVTNTGEPFQGEKKVCGGLENLRARLDLAYGNRARFALRSSIVGTIASIQISGVVP